MSDFSAAIIAGMSQAITSVCKDIMLSTVGLAKSQAEKLAVELEIGFTRLTKRTLERCAKVKTLLHRYEPIDIERAYVHPTIGISRKELGQAKFLDLLEQHLRIVITGMAGSGKSMFLKFLYVTLCRQPIGRIPIFIELRNLNNSDLDLLQYVHSQISAIIHRFSQTQLEYCLSHGKFVLLLDGLDEIEHQKRDKISDQILDLTFKYPRTAVLISSRPLDRFASWNEFHVGKILPLNKTQVNELIKKIDYDETTKEKFLKEVNSTIFETHEDFLSNPLLCTMMLMTFEEFAEIPSKMHIFYEQAFNVLYSRHDATKASFKRKFYTNLPTDDFKRILTTFCLFSYVDRKVSFNEETARHYMKNAIVYETLDVSDQMMVNDLQESICLLLRDGESLSFLHRSFQEYFTALFLAYRDAPQIGKIIETVVENLYEDTAIPMLVDMNKPAFEAKYFKKKLEKFCKDLSKVDISSNPLSVFKMIFSSIHYEPHAEDGRSVTVMINPGENYNTYSVLERFYLPEDHFPWFNEEIVRLRVQELSSMASDRYSGQIAISDLSNDFLIEAGFAQYAASLKDGALAALETINVQSAQRNNLVAEMLSR